MQPTVAPSMAPTESPSSAPTGALDELLEELPDYTLKSLKDFGTPQWLAWQWLSNYPDVNFVELWRQKQLFALATIFHSLGGPNWREEIRNDWLLYEKSECLWFSSKLGDFASQGGFDTTEEEESYWEYMSTYAWESVDSCNEDREFVHLVLRGLGSMGESPHLPPEIELLTSLDVLAFQGNWRLGHVLDFLPSQLYQMSSIEILHISKSGLSGTMPSQLYAMTNLILLLLDGYDGENKEGLGALTNLQYLCMNRNTLDGPTQLTTELGLLTQLRTLHLGGILEGTGSSGPETGSSGHDINRFIGSIPSELGLLTQLTVLSLARHGFTGSIPSEMFALTPHERPSPG